MPTRLQHVRLVALNIDGVLLNDTFSPVIHQFITSRGGAYTADVERRIFSQPRSIAGPELAAAAGLDVSGAEALRQYFEARAHHLEKHPVEMTAGAVGLLERLAALDVPVVCYGGLGREHFDAHLGSSADFFSPPHYVCTDTVRPGLKEIAVDHFGLPPDRALFIDDVARVAEEARRLATPFIGHPSSYPASFQRQLMREAGVRHLVASLDEVDEDLLLRVDAEAAAGTCWDGPS
ncbi:HAD family phosphatase [Streptomyces hyderabadensis]|uniref:HAD family hydrolase n=1 Tax=Streptomyces hyderabadensis TaxID=598549 RepID=A0ABP9IPK0_9ACTN|nr:HAD family phosphatase [Streptomyces hyderabadensis]